MTVICGGGASQPIPGFAPNVQVTTAMLQAAAINWPARWAIAYAAVLQSASYELTTMCATDPPADPGFTAADGLAMLNPWLMDPVPFSNASAKLQQLLQRYLWYQFCQCVSMATPAPPASPAAPANLPDPAPPLPGVPVSACVTRAGFPQTQGGGTYTFRNNASLIGLSATLLRVTAHNTIVGAPGSPTTTNIVFWDVSNAVIAAYGVTHNEASGSGATVFDCPIPSNATSVHADETFAGPGTSTHSVDFAVYCNGQLPGGTVQPCCPPDPTMVGMLENILGYVKLLQRQLAPFAYLSSTAHAGLTGAGTIAVQGLLGIRIDLTTIPASLHQDHSTPPFIFNVGWVSMEDSNGFIDEKRAHAQHQVWFPRIASDATLVGYSFSAGVVATITELQREP